MRLRHEPFGAWAMLDARPALVALDHEAVAALGVTPPARDFDERAARAPIEAHVSVTDRCGAGCEGCYVDAKPDGGARPREDLERTLAELAAQGVFVVAFGGGEPTTRDDLGELARAARAHGLFPVVTTSGLGLRDRQIDALKEFGAVNVSYDGAAGDYARVRGFEGASGAESAIARLARAGVHVGVNVVLTKSTLDRLENTALRAVDLGAVEIQLLRYKPSGRARSLDYFTKRLDPDQVATLGDRVGALVTRLEGRARVRIDCALMPLLAQHAAFRDAEALRRLGIFGCEGAGHLMAMRTDGRLAPCSFAAPADARSIDEHAHDPELARWRAFNARPPEPCASCTLFSVCKGGCKVVSSFVDGVHGPDPECPRVRAHRTVSRESGA